MKALERQNIDLEVRSLVNAQPVKIAQYRRHTVEFPFIAHESSSSDHYGLHILKRRGRKSIKCGITIVQSRQNERHHKGLKDRPRKTAADATYLSQSTKASGGDFGKVIVHREFRLQQNAQVANCGRRHDELVAHANRVGRKLMLATSSHKTSKVGF